MAGAVPLPLDAAPLWVSGKSRRPLIVLVQRYEPADDWAQWQKAVEGEMGRRYFIAHEVQVEDLADVGQDADVLGRVILHRLLAESAGGALYVPQWRRLPERGRQLLAAIAADPEFGNGVQVPAYFATGDRVRECILGKPAWNRSVHLEQLREALANVDVEELVTPSLHPERTREKVPAVIRDLRARGWAQADVKAYLEIFGYQNPLGNYGRWSHGHFELAWTAALDA